jgi:hypothetical protein
MYHVEFETKQGGEVTIFFTDKVTVQKYRNSDGLDEVCIMDGMHNNGGWKVKGSYQEVVNKIKFAIGELGAQ